MHYFDPNAFDLKLCFAIIVLKHKNTNDNEQLFKTSHIFVANIFKTIMDEQISLSKSYQFKAVLPNTLNANDTRFGSQSMQWMDEVAYITATRFTRQHMFIVNTENIKFLKAANANCFVEVTGRIENVEAVKLKVKVEIFIEKMYARAHDKAIEGIFIFA